MNNFYQYRKRKLRIDSDFEYLIGKSGIKKCILGSSLNLGKNLGSLVVQHTCEAIMQMVNM
jgi:hypothetical protein